MGHCRQAMREQRHQVKLIRRLGGWAVGVWRRLRAYERQLVEAAARPRLTAEHHWYFLERAVEQAQHIARKVGR